MGNSTNLSNTLKTAHKSLLSASTSIISNTATLTNAANIFMDLVEKIDARLKEIEMKEEELRRIDHELAQRTIDLDEKQTLLEEREKDLQELEQRINERDREWLELAARNKITKSDSTDTLSDTSCSDRSCDITPLSSPRTKRLTFQSEPRILESSSSSATNLLLEVTLSHQDAIVDQTSDVPEPIRKWLRKRRFSLLYKATRDGFGKEDFHRMCDGKGPTISIIESDKGYQFGGYTPISWGNEFSDRDNTHPDFFLFTLSNPHNIHPTQYKLRDQNDPNAIRRSGMHIAFGKSGFSSANLRVGDNDSHISLNSYSMLYLGSYHGKGMLKIGRAHV